MGLQASVSTPNWFLFVLNSHPTRVRWIFNKGLIYISWWLEILSFLSHIFTGHLCCFFGNCSDFISVLIGFFVLVLFNVGLFSFCSLWVDLEFFTCTEFSFLLPYWRLTSGPCACSALPLKPHSQSFCFLVCFPVCVWH
jgi:hypothetical protein